MPNYYLFRVKNYFFRVMKKSKNTGEPAPEPAAKSSKSASAPAEKSAAAPPSSGRRNAVSIGEIKKRKEAKRKVTLVRKANDLVEARYRFTIWEVRVFTKLLSLIRPDDTEFSEQKINILDIIRDYGLQSNKANYKWIKEGARGLMSKIIDMVVTADDGKPEDLMIPLLTKFKGRNDPVDGSYIKLSFAGEMKPFLLELRERYLQYDFSNVANLRSAYYVRIYELLKQYERIGQRRIELSELRAMLGIRDEYQQYGIFKRKIIESARHNINLYTDIQFTFEEIKSGKSVSSILFFIKANPQAVANRAAAKPTVSSRGAAKKPTVEQADFFPDADDAEIVEINDPLAPFAERLLDWWGVQRDEFFKRAEGKTAEQIEQAIQFTKERIRAGKATNPAGVFLDALTRGLLSPEQIQAQKEAERKRAALDRQARLKNLKTDYDRLLDEYAAAINVEVKNLSVEQQGLTEDVIEEIKNTQRLLGDRMVENATLDEFRKNPLLRSMVISSIMRRFPERFSPLNDSFSPKINDVKTAILEIEPGYYFS